MLSILAILLINILLGFLICFYGGKIVTWLVSILIILVSGLFLYSKYGYSPKNLAIFIVLAILILLAFNVFIRFGLFIVGGAIGGALGIFLVNLLPSEYKRYSMYIIVAMALLFAIIAAMSQKKVLAFLTALGGANLLSSSLVFLVFNIQNIDVLTKNLSYSQSYKLVRLFADRRAYESKITLGAVVVFTIMGYLFQTRKKEKAK